VKIAHPILGDIISEPSKSVHDGKRPANRLSSFVAKAHNPSTSADGGLSDDTLVLGPREPTLSCPLCKATHWLSQCKDFRRRNVSDRYQIAKEKALCYNCLIPSHYAARVRKQAFARCMVVKASIGHSYIHQLCRLPMERSQAWEARVSMLMSTTCNVPFLGSEAQ